jgi:hypothetical protein
LEVETDLPAQVEVTVGRSAAGLVVHLLNHTGLRRQSYGDPVTIAAGHRLTVRNRGAARAVVADRELSTEDGAIVLPELGLFEVLVLS